MKASIKFREDKKPLLRAKVPLNILGFPFQSGIVAGDSKELSLNLGTFFESGPSLKVAYRPNDHLNPFSLVLKSGIGSFGSAISSPMTMSAEFNPVGDRNPSFFIHFKPQFGDFSIKKSQSSLVHPKVITNPDSTGIFSGEDGSLEVVQSPVANGEFPKSQFFPGNKIPVPTSDSAVAATMIGGLLRGMEANAKTVFPVMNRAVVNFRWGFKFPAAEEATGGISIQKLPVLVMNKIGIEHLTENDPKDPKSKVGTMKSLDEDVAKACLSIKRQLEVMQAENGLLRKSVNDLKSDFNSRKMDFSRASGRGEAERGGKYTSGSNGNGGARVADRRTNTDKKSSEVSGGKAVGGDVEEELKKALMGA